MERHREHEHGKKSCVSERDPFQHEIEAEGKEQKIPHSAKIKSHGSTQIEHPCKGHSKASRKIGKN